MLNAEKSLNRHFFSSNFIIIFVHAVGLAQRSGRELRLMNKGTPEAVGSYLAGCCKMKNYEPCTKNEKLATNQILKIDDEVSTCIYYHLSQHETL